MRKFGRYESLNRTRQLAKARVRTIGGAKLSDGIMGALMFNMDVGDIGRELLDLGHNEESVLEITDALRGGDEDKLVNVVVSVADAEAALQTPYKTFDPKGMGGGDLGGVGGPDLGGFGGANFVQALLDLQASSEERQRESNAAAEERNRDMLQATMRGLKGIIDNNNESQEKSSKAMSDAFRGKEKSTEQAIRAAGVNEPAFWRKEFDMEQDFGEASKHAINLGSWATHVKGISQAEVEAGVSIRIGFLKGKLNTALADADVWPRIVGTILQELGRTYIVAGAAVGGGKFDPVIGYDRVYETLIEAVTGAKETGKSGSPLLRIVNEVTSGIAHTKGKELSIGLVLDALHAHFARQVADLDSAWHEAAPKPGTTGAEFFEELLNLSAKLGFSKQKLVKQFMSILNSRYRDSEVARQVVSSINSLNMGAADNDGLMRAMKMDLVFLKPIVPTSKPVPVVRVVDQGATSLASGLGQGVSLASGMNQAFDLVHFYAEAKKAGTDLGTVPEPVVSETCAICELMGKVLIGPYGTHMTDPHKQRVFHGPWRCRCLTAAAQKIAGSEEAAKALLRPVDNPKEVYRGYVQV